ncbi:MAG: hypothetical protein JWN76_1612 [Chitinophagaceae bacterium]|nr:hypothetical protein [Chitinophagaceae bacterium]
MKITMLSISFIAFTLTLNAQSNNTKYSKVLADSLGADDYGMKMYVLVILKTGKNPTTTEKRIEDSLFIGHLQNIGRLVNNGKLIVAGPLSKNKLNYEGIFILNVKTIAEATEILDTDPAIKAKMLDTELLPWYGSAALPLYLKFHDNVKKKDF